MEAFKSMIKVVDNRFYYRSIGCLHCAEITFVTLWLRNNAFKHGGGNRASEGKKRVQAILNHFV